MIKSADVDKGGGKTLIHKMWIKTVFFFNPSLMARLRGAWLFHAFHIKAVPHKSLCASVADAQIVCIPNYHNLYNRYNNPKQTSTIPS